MRSRSILPYFLVLANHLLAFIVTNHHLVVGVMRLSMLVARFLEL